MTELLLKYPYEIIDATNAAGIEIDAPERPVAVELGRRALALEAIMTYYNKANQVAGSEIQREYAGSDFNKRYGSKAAEVQAGARKNRNELLADFRRGISVLIAEDALRANRVDEADIDVERITMQAKLNRELGVGKAYAAARKDVLVRAWHTANRK